MANVVGALGWAAPLAARIPLIDSIYEVFSGGDKLTVLHLFCLIRAAPVTILYKILQGERPFGPGAADHLVLPGPTPRPTELHRPGRGCRIRETRTSTSYWDSAARR